MLNSKRNSVYHIYAYSDPDRGYGFSHTLEYVLATSSKEALAKSNYKGMLPGVHLMSDGEMETAIHIYEQKVKLNQHLHDQLFELYKQADRDGF